MCKRNGRTETVTLMCGDKKWHFHASSFNRRTYANKINQIMMTTEDWTNDFFDLLGQKFVIYEAYVVSEDEHNFTPCSEIYENQTLVCVEFTARATAQDPVQLELTFYQGDFIDYD